jgi:hypothetical protein
MITARTSAKSKRCLVQYSKDWKEKLTNET